MFLLLISCYVSGTGSSSDETFDPRVLDAVLDAADRGDYSLMDEAGRNGGEGAWFVLAAAAYDAGDDESARYARIRSAEEDVHPYGTRSLAMLLTDDPAALRRPMQELKKAAKHYGEDDHLRAARIAVLHHLGRSRDLIDEYEYYEGRPEDAPLLAAVMVKYPDDPTVRAVAERYILHSPEPLSFNYLPAEGLAGLGSGAPVLARARLAFAAGDYRDSLENYARWVEASIAAEAPCNLEAPPPVFAEMAEAAAAVDEEAEWSDFLSDAAGRLAGARRFGAAFQAGKLRRALGDYEGAAAEFKTAAEALGTGLQKDRALWYMLRVSYQRTWLPVDDEQAFWNIVWSGWEDPRRFDDQLEMFVHRRVRAGEWSRLEQVYADRGEDWPDSVKAQISIILAFAISEGRLSGRMAAGDYLEDALEADPVSWAGFRAAGLLSRDIAFSEEPFQGGGIVRGPGEHESLEDGALRLYLEWGLDSLAYRTVMDRPSDYSASALRLLSSELASESPRLSIRIAGLLWGIEGYYPNRTDLELRHPLPFGDMASTHAVSEGVPPEIFHGLIRTESAWDAWAVSRSGAMGLAQFMPATWVEWVRRMDYPEDTDPTDPEANAALGAAYLDWIYNREWTFGWIDSLASYNAGGGRIRTWRRELPGLGNDLFGESLPVEEPRSYIRKVLSAATVYGLLYSETSPADLHGSWGLDMIEVE